FGGVWRGWLAASTFARVCFAWIFFRANSLHQAMFISTHLFAGSVPHLFDWSSVRAAIFLDQPPGEIVIVLVGLSVLLAAHLLQRSGSLRLRLAARPMWFRWAVYYALILAILFGNP